MSRILFACMCWLLAGAAGAAETFTYQGFLENGAGPVDGSYDFRFTLSRDGGTGIVKTKAATAVVDGVFSVDLDFGTGSTVANTLEVTVDARPAGVGSYASFGKTALRPAPQAWYAKRAGQLTGCVYAGMLANSAGTRYPNGTYSLAFQLTDAATGGGVIDSTTKAVSVVNGTFSVDLGFPSTDFPAGVGRWLTWTATPGSAGSGSETTIGGEQVILAAGRLQRVESYVEIGVNAPVALTANQTKTVSWTDEYLDANSNITATVFTAPVAGIYTFDLQASLAESSFDQSGVMITLEFKQPLDTAYAPWFSQQAWYNNIPVSAAKSFAMRAGTQMRVRAKNQDAIAQTAYLTLEILLVRQLGPVTGVAP